jgi:hypothetical protein
MKVPLGCKMPGERMSACMKRKKKKAHPWGYKTPEEKPCRAKVGRMRRLEELQIISVSPAAAILTHSSAILQVAVTTSLPRL